jgi:phage regulator Rha-like protein
MKAETKLVEVHGEKLTTTSLVIAEQFQRPHHMVLKSLDKLISKVKMDSRDYIDSRGKVQRMYVLEERAFLIAMPFIGGVKSFEGQVKLVDEFLRLTKLINEPGRKAVIQHKRDTHSPMQDMLKFTRETIGKSGTETHHFTNENKFCNRALTGVYGPINEAALDVHDARKLAAIRIHNTMLMTRHIAQKDRRQLMDDFVVAYDIKHPRLKLIK